MKTNKEYIKENYIELSQLAKETGFSEKEILAFIEQEIIPNYSYLIESTQRITSPLNDEFSENVVEKYFAKSHISKLNDYKKYSKNPSDIKNGFKQKLNKILELDSDKKLYATDYLTENYTENLDKVLEKEWKSYCKGIYGICTINANENDIIQKDIAIRKLINFNTATQDVELNEEQKEELIQLNEYFNKVTTSFAPYQRQTSSRGKYLDTLLVKADLKNLMNTYDSE